MRPRPVKEKIFSRRKTSAEAAVKEATIPLKTQIAGLQSRLDDEFRVVASLERERGIYRTIAFVAVAGVVVSLLVHAQGSANN